MQVQIEQSELELPYHLHAALEILGRKHLFEQLTRQRRAGTRVRRHWRQYFPLPAEVLHELRGELDCIPLHAVDPGGPQNIHPRQQMVQPMAEFVEQRSDLIVREECRLVADRGPTITI